MTCLHAQGVSFRHPQQSQWLFDDLHLSLSRGDRLGLVGTNGAGKSSLLQLLAGACPPDRGQVWRAPGLRWATLAQAPVLGAATLADACWWRHPLLGPCLQACRAAEQALAQATGAAVEAAGWRVAEAWEAWAALGGWARQAEAEQALAELGFPRERWGDPPFALSGGEAQRLALLQLFLAEPDLLLLDEPTNHLDRPTRAWCQGRLAGHPGAMVLASHDPKLLGALVGPVLRLEAGRAWASQGGWAAHEAARAQREAQAWADHQGQLRRIAAAEAQAQERLALARAVERTPPGQRTGKDFYAAKAARVAKTARILRERPLKEAPAPKPRLEEAPRPLAFPEGRATRPAWALEAEGLTVARGGGSPCLEGLDLALPGGAHLGLMGPNGAGKTSLLMALAGELPLQAGRVARASGLRVAWVPQGGGALPEVASPAELMRQAHPDLAWGRSLLGAFRLRGRLAERPLAEASLGTRQLVAIALAMANLPGLLLLDEPTNHLDQAATEALAQTLASYPGAWIVASHDEAFLAQASTEWLGLEAGALQRGAWKA